MIEAYLADPCGTLLIPYYKMIRMQMPPQLRVVHDRALTVRWIPEKHTCAIFGCCIRWKGLKRRCFRRTTRCAGLMNVIRRSWLRCWEAAIRENGTR